MQVRFCDETDFSFSWIVDEVMQRCSHALAAGGRVWVVDPVSWEPGEERIRELGEPAGVIQLLDRHNRDCSALARRLGVPHHVFPREAIEGAPFEFVLVRKGRWWKEVALWWPERRVLVCADVLGTAPYFLAPGDRMGVHPLLRVNPPRRRLGALQPLHVLCGHGEGVHGEESASALEEALRTARRRLPRAWLGALRRR